MRKEFDASRGFTWVDPTLTHADVRTETRRRFEPLRDEQLKALMIQVARLSEVAGLGLAPAFAEALEVREAILSDHARRKASAEPDGAVTASRAPHDG